MNECKQTNECPNDAGPPPLRWIRCALRAAPSRACESAGCGAPGLCAGSWALDAPLLPRSAQSSERGGTVQQGRPTAGARLCPAPAMPMPARLLAVRRHAARRTRTQGRRASAIAESHQSSKAGIGIRVIRARQAGRWSNAACRVPGIVPVPVPGLGPGQGASGAQRPALRACAPAPCTPRPGLAPSAGIGWSPSRATMIQ